jgi:GntR family transcriptional regulator
MPPPHSALDAALAPLGGRAGRPLHRQVEDRLRRLTALPAFQGGALLPDELTLARRLGVSRGTARAALLRLVQEGLLERRAGVGTRVAPPRPASGIGAWRSLSREMAAQGIRVENFRTAARFASAGLAAARALRLEPGARVLRLDRVRGWNGTPVLISRSWLHPRLGLTGREDFASPLYTLIAARSGAVAETAREDFAGAVAGAAVARLLAVRPGAPLLLRRHTVYDRGGRPIEYAEVSYVSARFTLTLDLRREGS